jgi:hypothetical protein
VGMKRAVDGEIVEGGQRDVLGGSARSTPRMP